jgi:hypothetical protein
MSKEVGLLQPALLKTKKIISIGNRCDIECSWSHESEYLLLRFCTGLLDDRKRRLDEEKSRINQLTVALKSVTDEHEQLASAAGNPNSEGDIFAQMGRLSWEMRNIQQELTKLKSSRQITVDRGRCSGEIMLYPNVLVPVPNLGIILSWCVFPSGAPLQVRLQAGTPTQVALSTSLEEATEKSLGELKQEIDSPVTLPAQQIATPHAGFDQKGHHSSIQLSTNNKVATAVAGGAHITAKLAGVYTSGVHRAVFRLLNSSTNRSMIMIGVINSAATNLGSYPGHASASPDACSFYCKNGHFYYSGASAASGYPLQVKPGNCIGVTLDMDNKTVHFDVNGFPAGTPSSGNFRLTGTGYQFSANMFDAYEMVEFVAYYNLSSEMPPPQKAKAKCNDDGKQNKKTSNFRR